MTKPGAESTSSASQPEPTPDPLTGTVVDGRFRVESLLAVGGMGSVYRAEQVQLRRPVALKVLNPTLASSPEAGERFRQEAEVAAHLESDHVVKVIDFGKTGDGRFYLVMELLQGESLQALLQREKRLPPERAVDLLRQVLDGLQAAHAAGIVHRD